MAPDVVIKDDVNPDGTLQGWGVGVTDPLDFAQFDNMNVAKQKLNIFILIKIIFIVERNYVYTSAYISLIFPAILPYLIFAHRKSGRSYQVSGWRNALF